MIKISKLQYITNESDLKKLTFNVENACMAGVDWIQLRLKDFEYNKFLKYAIIIKNICAKYNSKLIINDNLEIALNIGADGVHLGKSDIKPSIARRKSGNKLLIGATANSYSDILELSTQKIDYIGLGPYRYTSTKNNLSPILGLEGYLEILTKMQSNKIEIPVIAIGGITVRDIETVLNTGVYGIAISSQIDLGGNVLSNSREFLTRISNTLK